MIEYVIEFVSLIFIIAIVGVGIWLYFYFRKQIDNVKATLVSAEDVETSNNSKIANIKNDYVTTGILQSTTSNLKNYIVSNANYLSSNMNSLNSNLNDMRSTYSNFQSLNDYVIGQITDEAVTINESVQTLSKTMSTLSNQFTTNSLHLGPFQIYSQSNNLIFDGPKINMNDVSVTGVLDAKFINLGPYTLSQNDSNLTINGTNPISLNRATFSNANINSLSTNQITFNTNPLAPIDAPYTLDVDPDGDLRLSMALGKLSIKNKDNQTIHTFDSQGNAMHSSNMTLDNGGCVTFGNQQSNPGKICYQPNFGMSLYGGGLSNNINVLDTLNVNKTINATNLHLGNLNIEVQNNQLVVSGPNGPIGKLSLSNI